MVAVLVIFSMASPVWATGKKATKKDCVDITREAQKMIREQGFEATLKKIMQTIPGISSIF